MPDIKSPYQVLKEFEQEFIHAIQQSIDNNDRHARGGLWQSVKAQTKIYGQTVVMEIRMDQYWKFVDKGVNGTSRAQGSEYTFKKKNIKTDAMLDFIRNRGIKLEISSPRKNKIKSLKSKRLKKAYKQYSIEKKAKGLAFVLGRSIAKKGLKPTHFMQEALDTGIVADLKSELLKAVGREIQIEVRNVDTD